MSLSFGDNLSDVVGKAFRKALPIPKTPRYYRPPRPSKPLSWIPKGKLGDPGYEERLYSFSNEIRAINSARTKPVRYSSRGWCYLLEGLGKIEKGEFSACQRAINDCRKFGLLPIDFVAEDQDETRRLHGILEVSDPAAVLVDFKSQVGDLVNSLTTLTTDYWEGEEYYLVMCVEKGDIFHLFKPICQQYHVPIVSSKGWPPILLRSSIAKLAGGAESKGLKPVVLLFYDHDPVGLKISETFRKSLEDIEQGTGYDPSGLIVDRFGLNEEDINSYNLTWIENLQTGSGREARDPGYVQQFGRRKCEANALFKNEQTLRAAEEICRKAIERYYGKDAIARFERKEVDSGGGLAGLPIWKKFFSGIDKLIDSFQEGEKEPEPEPGELAVEEATPVYLDNKHYGECPKCGLQFDYDFARDVGKVKRCRRCRTAMKLLQKDEGEAAGGG